MTLFKHHPPATSAPPPASYASRPVAAPSKQLSTFDELRKVTTWVRPPAAHGCAPAEIVPGLWNVCAHDIASLEQLSSIAPKVALVVNAAPSQCADRPGFYGENVEVLTVELEDDPDLQAWGKAALAGDPTELPLAQHSAGNAKQHFGRICVAISRTLAAGHDVVVHCDTSSSRSATFVLAFLMHSHSMSLLEAITHMKSKWDATWPCDRFLVQLIEFEHELNAPPVIREWLRAHPVF